MATEDRRITGTKTVIINVTLDPAPNSNKPAEIGNQTNWGLLWGTFTIDVNGDEGPEWEGAFKGCVNSDGPWYHSYVGNYSGDYKGLKLYAFSEVMESGPPPPPPPVKTWSFTGYILDPAGNGDRDHNDD